MGSDPFFSIVSAMPESEVSDVVDILNEQAASHAQKGMAHRCRLTHIKGMAHLTRTSKGRRITQTCTHQRHDSPVCVLVVPRPHTQIVILSIPVSLRVESSAPMRVVLGERDDTSLACRAEQRV